MQNIAAKEAKNNFGQLLDTAQREPVTIEKHGRAVAVVLSSHEYEKLKLSRLRSALIEGEQSEIEENYSIDSVMDALNKES